MAGRCGYRDWAGALSCARPLHPPGYCDFHFPANTEVDISEDFKNRLLELVRARDGAWAGFVFPKSLELKDLSIDFPVDLSSAQIGALTLTSCRFTEDVMASSATFAGPFVANNCDFVGLACDKAEFRGDVLWASIVNGASVFRECRFRQPVRIHGQFNGPSVWGHASFFDSVDFQGGWIAYMTAGGGQAPEKPFESHGLFGGETHLRGIDFRRPERSRFVKVDLRAAFVTGTDFRRVSFHDVTWPTLHGRRAIYDEIWDRNMTLQHVEHAPMLGEIGDAYRTIRVCIEDGKDFSTASDFYMGEMQARRKQLPGHRRYLFSVEALYWILSGYGCRPLRAFIVLIVILGLHALATGSVLYGAGWHLPDVNLAADSVKRTLSLLSPLRRTENFPALEGWWFLLDVVLGALVVVQSALLALALRGRIKRG